MGFSLKGALGGAASGFLSGGTIGALIGGGAGGLLGGGSSAGTKRLRKISQAPFEGGDIQNFLPPALRQNQVGGILQSGIQGIGDLIRNPGGLSPNVSDAIRQQLATQSEGIAQNFQGIGAQQAGAAARGNLPVSIKTALASALDIAQERAQRGARRAALTDTDKLRRQDLSQTLAILDALLQFTSSGRGQAIQGLGGAARLGQRDEASNLAFLGSLLSNLPGKIFSSRSGGKALGSLTPSGVSGLQLV